MDDYLLNQEVIENKSIRPLKQDHQVLEDHTHAEKKYKSIREKAEAFPSLFIRLK